VIRRASRAGVAGLLAAVAGAACYWTVLRPRHLRWGATDEECRRRWPGDELIPEPASRAVRAITVDAPPEGVWPWIMQVGRERGGFYSYTWLENLIGADIHNVYRRMPGLPDRRPGESVWMAPRERFGGMARMVVARVVPRRAMVLVPPDEAPPSGVWSFALEPRPDGRTRWVMLSLGTRTRVVDLAFWEPAHFVMERRMMLTIKRLAEAPSPSLVP
jgi:hypothetical protein